MINAVLSKFSEIFENLLPNEEYLCLSPRVLSGFFSILNDIKQTALKIFKDHNKRIECSPAHNKVVYKLWMIHR